MTFDESPLVSVIIPNYNHAPYLPLRISSVLNQTYKNIEVLILDDCSPDNSRDIINKYASEDQRIKVIFNEKNSGIPFKQWNKGVSASSGKYVWIAESDDYADETFLEKMLPILEEHKNLSFAYCQSYNVNEKNQIVSSRLEWTEDIAPGRWKSNFINDGREELANYFILKNTVPNASAVLIRKSKFLEAGGACEDMRLNGDKVTWTRLLLKGDVGFCAEHLNYFRHHLQNVRSKPSFKNKLENFIWASFLVSNVQVPNKQLYSLSKFLLKEWYEVLFNRQQPDFLNKLFEFLENGRKVSFLLYLRMMASLLLALPLLVYRKVYWQYKV